MSHAAAARALRIAAAIAVAAGALFVFPSVIRRDEAVLRRSNPRGIPLHILADERVVDEFRSMGYVSALTSQQPLHTLFSGMLDRELGPTHAFLMRELDRSARLTADAFNSPSTGEFYEKVLRDDESRRLYHTVAVRQWRCSEIMFGKKRPSPAVARMIEENIRDLERLGLGDWTGYDWDMYAAYWLAVGREEKAYDCYRKALAAYEASGDKPLASQSANKLGRSLLARGEWGEAERYLLESLEHANDAGDAAFVSRSLYALALLRASQGYFAEAESLLVQSVVRVSSIADPTAEIAELVGLADLYCGFGEHSRAGYLVERAVLLTERNLEDPAIASDRNLRFNMMEHLSAALAIQASIRHAKREYDGAIETARAALEIAEVTRDDRLRAKLLRTLGDAHAAAKSPKEAARCYGGALTIARRRRDRIAEASITRDLGDLSVAAGRFEKAQRELARALELNPDREAWTQEAEILRSLGKAKAGARDWRGAKELCVRAIDVLRAHPIMGEFDPARRASRDLVDSISTDLVLLESDVFRDCDSLIVAAEMARELRSGFSGIPYRDLGDAVRRCVERREWIPSNALVIQHVVTPGKLIVIAMDGARAEYRSISVPGERLSREAAALVDASGTGAAPAAALETARALYRLLLEPVSRLMEGKDVICFVPDEELRELPFGALALPGAGNRFLVEEKRIFASPGLLALEAGSAVRAGGDDRDLAGRAALIGKPEISPLLRRLYPELKSLPHARGELAELHRLIPRATDVVGREATKEVAIAALRGARLVHIATHGVHYPVYGGVAALLLSPPSPGPDGPEEERVTASLLTESEIAGLDLSGVELVVVSSCESGIDRETGLVRGCGVGGAFLAAGARSVVATLRPVEDAAAREFASAFYAELLHGGREPFDAHRRACSRMIAEDRASGNAARRIGVWGPYVLLGSFRPSAAD
jgi:CHAT domain-containing protein/tetratricopeptide (TPR) repeat protein